MKMSAPGASGMQDPPTHHVQRAEQSPKLSASNSSWQPGPVLLHSWQKPHDDPSLYVGSGWVQPPTKSHVEHTPHTDPPLISTWHPPEPSQYCMDVQAVAAALHPGVDVPNPENEQLPLSQSVQAPPHPGCELSTKFTHTAPGPQSLQTPQRFPGSPLVTVRQEPDPLQNPSWQMPLHAPEAGAVPLATGSLQVPSP